MQLLLTYLFSLLSLLKCFFIIFKNLFPTFVFTEQQYGWLNHKLFFFFFSFSQLFRWLFLYNLCRDCSHLVLTLHYILFFILSNNFLLLEFLVNLFFIIFGICLRITGGCKNKLKNDMCILKECKISF